MLDDEIRLCTFTLLSRVGSLRGITQEGLRVLASQGRRRTFRAGSVLVRQGKVIAKMYLVLGGCVQVERSHPQFTSPVVLAVLGFGDIIGEIGLLERTPQPVTAHALEDTDTIELGARALAQTLRRFPTDPPAVLPQLAWRSSLSFVQAYAGREDDPSVATRR